MGKRVIVCGGRDYGYMEDPTRAGHLIPNEEERATIKRVLNRDLKDGDTVVHGAARGADELCGKWAEWLGMTIEKYPADWNKNGRSAGPIRNQQMLDTGVDLVIAFPGCRGTAHMMSISRKAGVKVIDVAADAV